MRHVWSLIAGIVVAPLAWALLAMGQAGTAATITAWTNDNLFDTADLIQPAAYLVAAGLLLGLVATLRISPLGALVAALAYLALNVGLFINPFAVVREIPDNWDVFGEAVPLRTPVQNGTLLALGVLLVVAAFSAKRWRRWPAAPPAVPAEEAPPQADEEPTVVVPPAAADEQTATVPPPPSTYPPVSPAAPAQPAPDPGSRGEEEPTQATPRHAADRGTVSAPAQPYSQEPATSPWAAPPRPADRE